MALSPLPLPPDGAPMPPPMGGIGGGAMAGMAPPVPPEPPPLPMLHNVTVIRRKKYGCARTDPVPPEEFGITRRAKLGDKATWDYSFHETRQTEAALIAQGFDPAQVEDLPTADFDSSEEAEARDTVDDRDGGSGSEGLNPATRQIKITEHYILTKYEDDDKHPRLYRVTTAGEGQDILRRKKGKKFVPAIEPVAENPFDVITPYIMPHRFFGRSVADTIMDLQRIRTALVRTLLDSLYLASNQRTEVAEESSTKDTIDDLLNNRPGGLVRTKRLGGIQPIQNGEIGSFAYPLLEYTSQRLEQRTGVTRQGQGIDSNALMNQSATAVMQVYSAAQAKVKLIARVFAETGIKGLFLTLHGVIRRNSSVADTVRLKRKWVEVDPRQWKRRADMTVAVGIGSGTKEQQIAFLWQLLDVQKEGIMAPHLGLVSPENIYNTLKRLVEMGGLRSVDPFFTNPTENESPPEQPPDPKMIEIQGKMQIEQMKVDADRQKQGVDAQMKQAEMAARIDLEKVQALADIEAQNKKTEAEIALAQTKFDFDRQLKILEFQLKQREAAETQIATEAGSILMPTVDMLSQKQDAGMQALAQSMAQILTQHSEALLNAVRAPKRVTRDPVTNRVMGVEVVPDEPMVG